MIYTLHTKDKIIVINGSARMFQRYGMRLVTYCDKVQFYDDKKGINSVLKDRYHYSRDIQRADDLDSFSGKVYVVVCDDSKGDVLPFSTFACNMFFRNELPDSLRMIEVDFDTIPCGIRLEFLNALVSIREY